MLHPVLVILGVCFMGSAALIPFMYLGLNGRASIFWVIFSSTILINLMDIVWIFIARKLGGEKIEKLFFVRKNLDKFKKVETAIQKHGAKMLFMSKFIHGTGILSQLAAGLFRVNILRAMCANFFGSVLWTSVVFALIKGTSKIGVLEEKIVSIRLGTVALAIIFILLYSLGTKIAKKEMDKLSK